MSPVKLVEQSNGQIVGAMAREKEKEKERERERARATGQLVLLLLSHSPRRGMGSCFCVVSSSLLLLSA